MRIEFGDKLYCSPDDVARYFDKVEEFDGTTTPTETEVEAYIAEECTKIDRQTEHAYRENTVVEEIRDLDGPYYFNTGIPVGLAKRELRSLDASKGDSLEFWNGNEWEDWLTDSTYDEGRDKDYWLDKSSGILYIGDRYVFRRHPKLRLSYRYGRRSVPENIRQATAKLTAATLLESEQFVMTNISGSGESAIDPAETTKRYREDARRIIESRREVSYVEPY